MLLFNMKSINWHIKLDKVQLDRAKKMIKTNSLILLIGTIYLIWCRLTGIGIPCMFKSITNLYCPGCGITRMFLSLFQLDFTKAFYSNPLIFTLLPYGVFAYLRHSLYILKGKSYPYKEYHRYILIVILVITIAFGVVRNLPYFHFLRPEI